MQIDQKVLLIDVSSAFYRINRYSIHVFIGPVDLGFCLAGRYNSLNSETGLLAGSIFPGSNRLIFTGFPPCWGGSYISYVGGAGLVFDNLGINMLSIVGKAVVPYISESISIFACFFLDYPFCCFYNRRRIELIFLRKIIFIAEQLHKL